MQWENKENIINGNYANKEQINWKILKEHNIYDIMTNGKNPKK